MKKSELRSHYTERLPILGAWGDFVTLRILQCIEDLIQDDPSHGFIKIPPVHRVKEIESFLEKATGMRKSYEDPLSEITDQVGVRFVVLLLSDMDIVGTAISSCDDWDIEKARDIDFERDRDPHYFDYQSDHWVVRPLVDVVHQNQKIPRGTACEIQVRTLLQHAYAELAHPTIYKPRLRTNSRIIRSIAKTAALVETTDEVFRDVSDKIKNASASLDLIYENANDWYFSHIENGQGKRTQNVAAMRILDAYSKDLLETNWEQIAAVIDSKVWLLSAIREHRSDFSLFNNPVIVLVYWLVIELEQTMPENWPLSLELLAPVFSDLSIATEGCLD